MVRRCANCGIEIKWQPTVIDGVGYCCPGCSRGGPCDCDYSNLPQDRGNRILVFQGQQKTVIRRVRHHSKGGGS